MPIEERLVRAEPILEVKQRLDRHAEALDNAWRNLVAEHAAQIKEALSTAASRLKELRVIPQRVATHESGEPAVERYIPLTLGLAGELPGFVLRDDGRLFVLPTSTDIGNKVHIDWTGKIREATNEEIVEHRDALFGGIDLFVSEHVPMEIRRQIWRF